MWFGTEAGLARFDGRRTQALVDPNLPNGRVLALSSAQDGSLWVGTDSGAARLAAGRFEPVKETSGKVVTAIITPERSRAIIATEQGMLFDCLARPDGTVEARSLVAKPLESADRDHSGPLPLTSLIIAHDQLLAGSRSRGLLLIENGSAKEIESRPSAYFIQALETDSRGQIWVGIKTRKEESGFYLGNEVAQLTKADAPTGTVMALRAGTNDDMWVGTDGRGVFRFSGSKKVERFTFDGTAGGLRSDHVYSIFIDREEVAWFGTDRGVCRYDPHAPQVESIAEHPESNFVRTLYRTADGHLLAGTNRGLFAYAQSQRAWHVFPDLERNVIYAVAEDNSGRLLVGSAGGFYVAQKSVSGTTLEDQTFTRLEAGSGAADATGSIRAIVPFQGGLYIASYGRGIERFEDSRLTFLPQNESPGAREVISLFADGNRLLIGTANAGVFVFDGQEARSDSLFANLNGNAVRSIDRTPDGTLWFATNRGVYFCRPRTECQLAASNVDARNLVANQAGNANEVWCATTGGGVLKLLLDANPGPVVSQIDVEQGLPSQNAFTLLTERNSDGRELLLIGTSRGIARYEPGHSPPALNPTRIISKRIHQPDELRTGLSLEYPQNSLVLDVTAISSRTFPEQFQYAFVLSDGKGNVIKQKLSHESQFAMEGLKPGKYKVMARGFTKDLVASNPLSFEFSVASAPFPWTSTALAVLLALALVALLWAILERKRIVQTSAALLGANRELADARLNLANEAERERRRIARDLHDQTLADLRHLLLLTDRLPTNGASVSKKPDASVLRREIESISQEVRLICEDLSPSVLQNVGLGAALEFALTHAVERAGSEQKLKYEFLYDETLEEFTKFAPNVQMQIYRIIQEAVSNISRHAGASYVRMFVECSPEGDFELRLEDNGRDFEPKEWKKKQGRGLANMRARASLIEAEVSWARREGGGTVFILKKTPPAKVV
jgi:signal transduction histidine kinase/ligand-binding sensor domain-containing protein